MSLELGRGMAASSCTIYLTDQTGHYTIDGIRPGQYYLWFVDPASGNEEFWDDQPNMDERQPGWSWPPVTALTGIDAVLGGPVGTSRRRRSAALPRSASP